MKITDIRKQAKARGLKLPIGMRKGEIIRAIQTAEGNFPCFGTPTDYCDRQDCAWRADCLPRVPAASVQA